LHPGAKRFERWVSDFLPLVVDLVVEDFIEQFLQFCGHHNQAVNCFNETLKHHLDDIRQFVVTYEFLVKDCIKRLINGQGRIFLLDFLEIVLFRKGGEDGIAFLFNNGLGCAKVFLEDSGQYQQDY
jgi:hypothetical protein